MDRGTILLAGASGYIGTAVSKELLSRGYNIICPSRRSISNNITFSKPNSVLICNVDLCSTESVDRFTESCPPIDVVISCIASRTGGISDSWNVDYNANMNLLKLASRHSCKKFILLSAICVQKPRLTFQHAKIAFENELIESGIVYSIVRPTAFFKSLAGQVERVKSGRKFILFGNGTQTSCKPISERDLASYLCDCISLPERNNSILPIGGPGKAITPLEQGKLLFTLTGQPEKFKRVSSNIFPVLAGLITPFTVLSPKILDYREFLRIGHYYATESMLTWDKNSNLYSEELTPVFGADTLEKFYKKILSEGIAGQELGQKTLF